MIGKPLRWSLFCSALLLVIAHAVSAAPPVDRANAINGTWSGTILTLYSFPSPYFSVTVGSPRTITTRVFAEGCDPLSLIPCPFEDRTTVIPPPTTSGDSVTIPIVTTKSCNFLPCNLATTNEVFRLNVSPEESLAKSASNSDLVFTLKRTGPTITGTVSSTVDETGGEIDGVAVSNSFFLLRIVGTNETGACSPGNFQGSASIAANDPNLMIFTGSGVGPDCGHQVFSIRFVRQP